MTLLDRACTQILKPGWHKFDGARDGTLNEKRFNAEHPVVRYHAHTDWVSKAAYVEQVNSMVSVCWCMRCKSIWFQYALLFRESVVNSMLCVASHQCTPSVCK